MVVQQSKQKIMVVWTNGRRHDGEKWKDSGSSLEMNGKWVEGEEMI